MKELVKKLFLPSALIAGLGWLLSGPAAAQTYTFGTEITSTNTAGITYNSGTGEFQYTDNANPSDDTASLPLTGAAAGLINSTNSWHASVGVSVTARSLTATDEQSPNIGMGLSVVYVKGETERYASLTSGQVNNTGSAQTDFPADIYGTGAHFLARSNELVEVTTPLGKSENVNGDSILPLSQGTNLTAATESVIANTGVVTLSYDASTETVTGYYNGSPVGSYSIAGWGANPPLTLYVFGASGGDVAVAAATDTAANFNAGAGTFSVPQLAGVGSGANLVLSWPTNATGFALQSTTNLGSPAWTAVSPAPVVVSGQNTVTNPISGAKMFYRLMMSP